MLGEESLKCTITSGECKNWVDSSPLALSKVIAAYTFANHLVVGSLITNCVLGCQNVPFVRSLSRKKFKFGLFRHFLL